MAPQQRAQRHQKEGRISLAVNAYRKNQISSIRKAATTYNIPESTLRTRPQHEIRSQKRTLRLLEEEALVKWILDLDRRGFPPHIIHVREMATVLLAARGSNPPPKPIGKNGQPVLFPPIRSLKQSGTVNFIHNGRNARIRM